MLAGSHGKEADKGHLHAGESADGVEGAVRDVEAGAEAAHEDEHEGVEGDHVGDEYVATP